MKGEIGRLFLSGFEIILSLKITTYTLRQKDPRIFISFLIWLGQQ